MPEKRGRKRRSRDRRERMPAPAEERGGATQPAAGPAPAPAVPSNTARATGLAIGVITVFLAIMTVTDAFSADRSTLDATTRIVIGGFLVVLGVVVSALSLFPAQIRRMVRGV